MEVTRREIGMIAGAASLAAALPGSAMAAAEVAKLPWYRTVKRLGQTNFNERDPESGDVEAWADYWASAKVQAVILSVSGLVAFYPTKVPFFRVSPYLKGRDLFGECLTAAKQRGIRVIGRMSPDILYADPELVAAHPLWLRRDKQGKLQHSAPDIAFTCQFSDYFTDQQPAILRELLSRYEIDGLYMNGWPTLQSCYCDNCRKIGDPESAAYKAALLERVEGLIDLYRGILAAKNPDIFYSCNLGGGLGETGLDQWKLTRNAEWYTADNQARIMVEEPVWQAAQQVKYARALMGDRAVAAPTASYSRAGPAIWRQATEASWEPVVRLAQTSAADAIMWIHQLGLTQGLREDRRWQAPARDFLSWHAANDAHFHNNRSLANVGIVVPANTLSHSEEDWIKRSDYVQGFYAALVEARIPFDFIHENDLGAQRLAPYDLLILPNFARMSDVQARAIKAYAARGGALLATYQTGLFREDGAARPDFALGDLFGIAKAGEATGGGEAALGYFVPTYTQRIRQRGPLTAGFEDTSWIAGPYKSQTVTATGSVPFTFIEHYPIYPPEAVYPREPVGNRPALVTREAGGARLAYLAGDMDATFWRYDNTDLSAQIVNTVRWLLNGKAPVTVTGDGLIEVIGWQTRPGYAIHLLNYNGPNAFRGHMRKPLPLGQQVVRVTLADAKPIRSARLLREGGAVAFRQTGRTVEVTVPRVGLHEIVALEV